MTKSYLKKCSPSLTIREMQTKTTLKFHLLKSEWLRSSKQLTIVAGDIVEKKRALIPCWWDWNWCNHLENKWKILKTLQIKLPYNLATSYLNIFPKDLLSHSTMAREMGTTWRSFNRWMDSENVIHIENRIPFSCK